MREVRQIRNPTGHGAGVNERTHSWRAWLISRRSSLDGRRRRVSIRTSGACSTPWLPWVVRAAVEPLGLQAGTLEPVSLATRPRNTGAVVLPGDLRPEDDRYWGPSPSPDDAEIEAIERVRACRDLADRLADGRSISPQ